MDLMDLVETCDTQLGVLPLVGLNIVAPSLPKTNMVNACL